MVSRMRQVSLYSRIIAVLKYSCIEILKDVYLINMLIFLYRPYNSLFFFPCCILLFPNGRVTDLSITVIKECCISSWCQLCYGIFAVQYTQ